MKDLKQREFEDELARFEAFAQEFVKRMVADKDYEEAEKTLAFLRHIDVLIQEYREFMKK